MFIDTHCHIDFYEENKIKEIIERARLHNVKLIVENAVNEKDFPRILELTNQYPEVKAALGVYPIDALKLSLEELDEVIGFIRTNKDKIIAIGEVGLDLKWSKELDSEKERFQKFIDLAIELDKPIIVHSRNAEREAIDMLIASNVKKVVLHCLNIDKKSLIKRAVKRKWFFSIPTNVTFSETFKNLVKEVPIDNLLCETDSPYLHPVKGEKNNEPMNVIESYRKISEIKDMSLSEVEKRVEENFFKLFGNI